MKKIILLFSLALLSFGLNAETPTSPIHIDVSGKGSPILLIPGFTVPGAVWTPLVDVLKTNYECHVITLAGFGGKDPIAFPWLPKINAALENYIIENELSDVSIIGHSLGGTIATWLATRNNLNISNIIIVDALPASGALMIPNFNPDELVYDSPYNNQQLAMDDKQFEEMAEAMAQGMSRSKIAQQKITSWILQSDRKTYVFGYTDYLKLDLREDLKKITIPVTIIAASQPYGEDNVKMTYKNQYENLTQYNFILAKNSAHFIMLDRPEWFKNQIKEILDSK